MTTEKKPEASTDLPTAPRDARAPGETLDPPADPVAQADPGPSVAELEAQVEALTARLAASEDAHLRAVAELENYKRRASRELQDRSQFANERLMSAILPALDNCDRAIESLQGASDTDAVLRGVELVARQLHAALAAFGLEEMPAEGQHFDPKRHEAVASVASAEHPDGSVVHVERKGYALHGRTLRPAHVVVAKAPEERAPDGD